MEVSTVPQVVSLSSATHSAEETMLREDRVRETLARLARGEGSSGLASLFRRYDELSARGVTFRPGPRQSWFCRCLVSP